MLGGGIEDLVVSLFSFFGHYGVSVFVFVSGYGLACKYSSSKHTAWQIIKSRTIKLWLLLLPFALLLLTYHLRYGDYNIIWDYIKIVTFTSNFIGDKFIIAGPWWFFGMIFQLYVLYAFILRRMSDRILLCVMAFVWILLIALSLADCNNLIFDLRYNSIGWLPVFIVGLLAAKHPINVSWKWALVGMLLCIPMFFLPYLWVFSSTLVLLYFICLLRILPHGLFRKIFIFIGGISSAIFVTHSSIRRSIFYSDNIDPLITGLGFLFFCILCGWIYSNILKLLNKFVH